MPVTRSCDRCGAVYTRPPSLVGKYCSPACAYEARRERAMPGEYRLRYRPGHPLATDGPYIGEHRLLLYDLIGPGPHPCHRCGQLVDWAPRAGTRRGSLVVDHRDGNPANNRTENLAPSCQSCNNLNSDRAVKDDEVFVVRKAGTRLRGEQRSCAHCGAAFVAWPDPRPNRGRFCSRSCARSKPPA